MTGTKNAESYFVHSSVDNFRSLSIRPAGDHSCSSEQGDLFFSSTFGTFSSKFIVLESRTLKPIIGLLSSF